MIHTFNRFILRSARERVTENRDKVPMGPSRGYVVLRKGQRSYVTTALRPVIKTGQAQPADGRRRKTTGSRPTVAEIPTRCNMKLAEKTETGGHDRFVAHV